MAIIPLKQFVTVRKRITGNTDGWEADGWSEPFNLKCRAVETVKTISSSSMTEGFRKTVDEHMKATLVLYFDKFPDIDYDSEISFVNESGIEITRNPILISPIRMVNGKVTLTEVHL